MRDAKPSPAPDIWQERAWHVSVPADPRYYWHRVSRGVFALPRPFSLPLLLASSAPVREIGVHSMEDKTSVRVPRVHRSFVPSLSCSSRSRGQEFFRLSRFFQEKRSIFPSFSLFPFFRWFFWQQAINPIIGLGEPLFVPVDDPPLSILSLSGV